MLELGIGRLALRLGQRPPRRSEAGASRRALSIRQWAARIRLRLVDVERLAELGTRLVAALPAVVYA
jgi:hypothetical protein